jgi:nicotinamide mononucleotide transporter
MEQLLSITAYYANLPITEWIAVLLSIAYVILAARENQWCWLAAFLSTAIYTILFFHVNLLMDSLLNAYYLIMAVYGWLSWRGWSLLQWCQSVLHTVKPRLKTLKEKQTVSERNLRVWLMKQHVFWSLLLTLISIVVGYGMASKTSASFPYLDTFTTVFSLFATYLLTQKIVEQWLYWIVIDLLEIYIYIQKGLLPTASLFVIYVVLAIVGYSRWRQKYQQQTLSFEASYC